MFDYQTWWRTMRMRCSPLQRADRITRDELAARAAAGLAWVAPPARFVLPPRFGELVDVLDATSWYGHHISLDFVLYAPAAMASVDDDPDTYEDHAVVREAGLWLAIGSWSDKHELFLCCDRERPQQGHVFDAHDDHPYLNGTRFLHDLGPLETWLAGLAGPRRPTDRSGLLVGLTAEERVELDPVLEDPWALVVAARDLAYRLRPDAAWRRTTSAPERVLAVASPPPVAALPAEDHATIALIPTTDVARFQRASYSVGAWAADGRFANLEDGSAALAALAQAPGGILYIG